MKTFACFPSPMTCPTSSRASANVTIASPDAQTGASFALPAEPGKEVHIILEVTDKGSPPLTRYQRVVVKIQ